MCLELPHQTDEMRIAEHAEWGLTQQVGALTPTLTYAEWGHPTGGRPHPQP